MSCNPPTPACPLCWNASRECCTDCTKQRELAEDSARGQEIAAERMKWEQHLKAERLAKERALEEAKTAEAAKRAAEITAKHTQNLNEQLTHKMESEKHGRSRSGSKHRSLSTSSSASAVQRILEGFEQRQTQQHEQIKQMNDQTQKQLSDLQSIVHTAANSAVKGNKIDINIDPKKVQIPRIFQKDAPNTTAILGPNSWFGRPAGTTRQAPSITTTKPPSRTSQG